MLFWLRTIFLSCKTLKELYSLLGIQIPPGWCHISKSGLSPLDTNLYLNCGPTGSTGPTGPLGPTGKLLKLQRHLLVSFKVLKQ